MGVERAALARACALVGTAALVAAGGAVLWSRSPVAAGAPRRVLLLDASGSVQSRWRDPAAVLGRIAAAAAERATIVYGADVARCEPGGLRARLATLDSSGTELDRALEAARAVLGDAGERSIAIASDGGFTGGDPRPRLAALAEEGVGLEWLELPPRERAELVLGEPRAGEARSGAPLAVELPFELEASVGDPGPRTLLVECEHAGAVTRSQVPIAAPLRLEFGPLEPGETLLSFSVPGDPLSRRELRIVPEGSLPRAAVVGPISGLARVQGGPEWIALDAARFARELESFDLLLTTDVDWAGLPADALRAWIERGGAWIACAGPANYPHEWGRRGLSELLPLAPAGEGLPPRDVVILVDGSGSMVGEPWNTARAALARLADAAGEDEQLRVRTFAGVLGPVQPLGASAPGGPTALCDALEALAREPSERERLVVLLSDGQDRGGKDALARAPKIAAVLAGARITLAAIAIGADANVELLRALASPGEELLACPSLSSALDPAALVALFQRQLGARRWARDLPGLSPAPASVLDLPHPDRPLARCAALRAEAGANVLLFTPEHAPALAIARRGLGWCAAAGFDPPQSAFDPWNTLGAFLARSGASARVRLSVRGARVRVENLPGSWAKAELRAGNERAELVLAEHDGALEAELPPALQRRAWTELSVPSGTAEALVLPWPQAIAPEQRLPRSGIAPGERLAARARLAGREQGPGPLALGLVGAGLAFTFLGAGLGFFSRARAATGKSF